MYVCTYVRTYVCMYVCMYVCIYVCVCIFTQLLQCMYFICNIINVCTVGGRIFFNETSYDVAENAGSVQLVLVLSTPLSTMIVVQVDSIGGLAIGEHIVYIGHWILSYYNVYVLRHAPYS